MENDDRPVGRILSRREVLALFGTTGAALLAACTGVGNDSPDQTPTSGPASPMNSSAASGGQSPTSAPTLPPAAPTLTPAAVADPTQNAVLQPAATQTAGVPAAGGQLMCIARPEQTEGPYFRDEKLTRSDIRSDPASGNAKEGALLRLNLRVSQAGPNSCTPLPGALVDIWHCDAEGIYSDVNDPRFSTVGQQFLRGNQVTDANGLVTFVTIYPGWYPGRAVHIHFKIRANPDSQAVYEFTSQLYFDDALSDQVFSQPLYSGRGQDRTRNAGDGPFGRGGEQLILPVTQEADGYAATFDIGLQFS